ncbi:hypothetical protein HPB47_003536 [Ixodes persulcatus]|uniref:Uncharacterized protein n=1 Tax=Ixodes persulcatus TaxID=34615 RepID=A0AC60PIB2_IXOPE|nr:hypothetical protein HPB47_003536 [Ixodes persulcatus]
MSMANRHVRKSDLAFFHRLSWEERCTRFTTPDDPITMAGLQRREGFEQSPGRASLCEARNAHAYSCVWLTEVALPVEAEDASSREATNSGCVLRAKAGALRRRQIDLRMNETAQDAYTYLMDARREARRLPRCWVDREAKGRRLLLNRLLARDVRQMADVVLINPHPFFLNREKAPKREYVAADGYHVHHGVFDPLDLGGVLGPSDNSFLDLL